MRLLACLVAALLGATQLSAQPPADYAQPQSPPKPAPEGIRYVDQGRYDPRLSGYVTPEGFRVEVVATEPTIINPVGMTFADDGTLVVLEWRPSGGDEWRETPVDFVNADGTVRRVATMKKKVKDVAKVLTFNPQKGTYDRADIVLEDELPSSILLHDGWLYLSGRGTVRRYRQSKPGGPYDVKEVIAHGFCGFHHHQVSGMTIGNDGWLYLTSGDDDNYVEGSDGSRATVLRTGAVFRCRPDGSRMQTYSIGWRNPYRDIATDDRFNWFHVDNDNEDGSKFTGCRLMHVAEEADFGWRLFTGARCCKPDAVRGAVYGELPGKMPPMLKTGRGSPAGLLIYNDTRLPIPYRGLLYYPDVFRRLVRAYKVEPDGSTFQVAREFEFLKVVDWTPQAGHQLLLGAAGSTALKPKSADPLFRPCQMVTGPDGAIYVCDWRTDSGGAGRLWGDGVHGRIYRITWAGGRLPGEDEVTPAIPRRGMDSWAKVRKLGDEELLKALSAEDMTDRVVAQKEIIRRGDKFRPALLKLVADPRNPLVARLGALGALQSFWNAEVRGVFFALLRDESADVQRLAADALALNCQPGDRDAHAALLQVLGDPDPSVRRAVALAIGKINAPSAGDVLVNAYKFNDGKDVYLTDGILRAVERTGRPGLRKLIDLANSGSDADRNKVVAAFLTLRSRPASELAFELMANPHLAPKQRAAIVYSLRNYLFDPPLNLDRLFAFLANRPNDPDEVKAAGIEVLAETGQLKGPKAANLMTDLLNADSPTTRLSAIRAIEVARMGEAAPRLVQVLGEAKRPPAEREAIIKALRVLGDRTAVNALKEILSGQEPASLRVEALRSLAAINPDSARPIAKELLDQTDPGLLGEAVIVLGAKPEGAKLVGERFVAKKLPRELLPQVSDALRRHSGNPAIGKLLGEVMRGGLKLTLDPTQVERIKQLVQKEGNAQRGKAVYLNAKLVTCVSCHRLEGVGGNVGPDLTRIWETISVEKIMEAIVEPSKEIKEGYQAYRATTLDGEVFTGLKMSETKTEVVLRDANGKDVRIARADLDTLGPSKTSLMPDNAAAQLSFREFIDLIAFLKNRGAQESLRGVALDFLVAGPFGPELKASYPPEAKPDPTATYTGPDSRPVSWQSKLAEPNGYLDLKSAFNKDGTSAYALTYVFSPKAQRVPLLLGSGGSVRVWLNGKLVHEHGNHRGPRQDQDRTEVPLQQGWNPLLVKVTSASGPHGLFLRFAGGEGLRISAKPE